jgi:hypothetical protein
MRWSRARRGVARTLPKRDVEERLEDMIRRSGEGTAQRLRDEARAIAGELHLRNEFRRLDTLIGTLLGSRETPLESPVAVARAAGLPSRPHPHMTACR